MTAKPIKFQLMLSDEEAERLDTYAAENELRSRAEAIRRLCDLGLELDRESYSIRERMRRIVSSANRTAKSITGANARISSASDDQQRIKLYEKAVKSIGAGVLEALDLAGDVMTSVSSILAKLDPKKSTEDMSEALKSARRLNSDPNGDEEQRSREILEGHQNIQDRLRRDDST